MYLKYILVCVCAIVIHKSGIITKIFGIPENINDVKEVEDEKSSEVNTEKACKDAEVFKNDFSSGLYNNGDKVDYGMPLFLTPFIKTGRNDEARKACSVDPKIFLGVKSYSGYLNVNETYNSNLFFWYFPSLNKPVDKTPWVIWQQGGPGVSFFIGLFAELGPFRLLNGTIKPNEHTWLRNHSLVFIESPVGTGYSFTEHPDGYARDTDTYTAHLYSALKQIIQLFPELSTAPLYIAGESYGGKSASALGLQIHNNKNADRLQINFKGLMLGNALMDPAQMPDVSLNFYNFGMIDKLQYEMLKPISTSYTKDVAANRTVEAKAKWRSLINLLIQISNQKHGFNFLVDDYPEDHYDAFAASPELKRALHVGDAKYEFRNVPVKIHLASEFWNSRRLHLETLLEHHYRVLVYCGQIDQLLTCPSTAEFYRTLQWSRNEEFLNSTRYPFMHNGKLAGYHKSGGGLTEVLVRGAGHLSPADAPAQVQGFVTLWTHQQSLGTNFPLVENSLIKEAVKNITRHDEI